MSDELRDALRTSLERGLRRPQPNLAEVIRRGRRKRAAMVTALAVTLAAVAGSGYVAADLVAGIGKTTGPAGDPTPPEQRGCPESRGSRGIRWTSPTVLVARGEEDGDPWVLCARTAADEKRGAETLCTSWQFRTPLGSGMDCAFGFRRNGKPVALGKEHFSPIMGPDEGYLFGTAPAAAATIELVTDDGGTFAGVVHPAPRKLGVPFQLFTLFAEPYAEGDLVVRDAGGDVIRTRRMEHDLTPLTVETAGSGRVVGYRTELLRIHEECGGTESECGEPRPAWIDCGDECEAALAGAGITLVAEPAEGWRFAGWGGACTGTAPECELVVDRPLHVEATFEEVP
ncbi:MAG TPA: hypothetical protein VG318_11825 [Actinomycetota bacterium]|nr:hypothetical protein [Actinomycetota bacterium]